MKTKKAIFDWWCNLGKLPELDNNGNTRNDIGELFCSIDKSVKVVRESPIKKPEKIKEGDIFCLKLNYKRWKYPIKLYFQFYDVPNFAKLANECIRIIGY